MKRRAPGPGGSDPATAAAAPAALDAKTVAAASAIIARVAAEGDAALRALTRRFDGVAIRAVEIPPAAWRRAARAVDPRTRAAIRFAARRIAAFARLQKRSIRPLRSRSGGVVLEQRLLPVERVGVYAPGGRHPLLSSVLMGAIPARVAGCRTVVLCTPPRPGGVAPEILAAAAAAGVDRVFAVGGAQAIAALALGTESVPAVDLIVGPGNRYVAAAKTLLSGRVGIDFHAGPSELLVIADRASDPLRVAADLLGQAEHDPDARVALVAVGRGRAGRLVAAAVRRRLRALLAGLPEENRRTAAAALRHLRVAICADEAAAAAIADRAAPEHLSVQTKAPRRLARRLNNYGSLFLGRDAPIALGDYVSGPNHVLPTAGAARHTGGLSVLRFLRAVTVQEVDGRGLRRLAPACERLAAVEGLEAHRMSVALRAARPRPGSRFPAPEAGPRAVLFDFDGVLVASERAHHRAFAGILRPLGARLTWSAYRDRYLAFDDATALSVMLRDFGIRGAPSIPALVRRKRALFARLTGGAPPVAAAAAGVVRGLAERLPLAIVSGAARAEIAVAVRRAGIANNFRTVVAAEDVRRSKPDPEGYRLALRRLGIGRPDGCVAFEDSPGGIRAARAAGLRVIGVASTYPPALLRRAGAAAVIPSLAALGARRAARLLSLP